jgi:hypothetical protein
MKLLLVLLFALPTFAQEHAPTKDVCQADVAVWYSHEMSREYAKAETDRTTEGIRNRTALAKIPLDEADKRQNEMYDCMNVDPERVDLYFSAGNLYYSIFTDRALSFIRRHHLEEKFRQEDAAGVR